MAIPLAWAAYAAGAALLGAIWGGCNESKAEEEPDCDYNDPKNICTLTLKPAGPTQVEINQGGKIDRFVATETNFIPTKLYSNICPQWRPGIALYTVPSNPYPEELEVSPESGISSIGEIEGSNEPFVRCVSDGTNGEEILPGDPWGVLSREGTSFYGVEPAQIRTGLRTLFLAAQSVEPDFNFVRINPSPRELLFLFEVNNRPRDNDNKLIFGIVKVPLSKIDPSKPAEMPSISILSRIEIDRRTIQGDLLLTGFDSPGYELPYIYRREEAIDSRGDRAGFSRAIPTYAFFGDFQKQKFISLPQKLNYDPINEKTVEGKPWSQYATYVTTTFSSPIVQNNQIWIAHTPTISPYEELWKTKPTLKQDLEGVHHQTADATLTRIDPQTGMQIDFRVPFRGVGRVVPIQGTDQVAFVGYQPPFSYRKIKLFEKEVEVIVGMPILTRIGPDGTILQTLPIGTEPFPIDTATYYPAIFENDGLEISGDQFRAIYRNGQYEQAPLTPITKVEVQSPFLYEEWDRGGKGPLQVELDRVGGARQLGFSLWAGPNRNYTLLNLKTKKAVSWTLPRSENPANLRSRPCYNAAWRDERRGGGVRRDQEGNTFFGTFTCEVERGRALVLPTDRGLQIYTWYNDEILQYLIPNGML